MPPARRSNPAGCTSSSWASCRAEGDLDEHRCERVIINRALKLAGRSKGDYSFIRPNDYSNHSQSINDTCATAIKIALACSIVELFAELTLQVASFEAKSRKFAHIVKVGRTQLQSAVPITLGQEFKAFAVTLGEDVERLQAPLLCSSKSTWEQRRSAPSSMLPTDIGKR